MNIYITKEWIITLIKMQRNSNKVYQRSSKKNLVIL